MVSWTLHQDKMWSTLKKIKVLLLRQPPILTSTIALLFPTSTPGGVIIPSTLVSVHSGWEWMLLEWAWWVLVLLVWDCMIHSGVQDGDGDQDSTWDWTLAGEDLSTILSILSLAGVDSMIHSGVWMPGVRLGDGIDRYTLLDQSLSSQVTKIQVDVWYMELDQAEEHPWVMGVVG